MRTEDKATISAARSRRVSRAWMSIVWAAARPGWSWSVFFSPVLSRGLYPNATSRRSKII